MTGYCKGYCTSPSFPYDTDGRVRYDDGFKRCHTCSKSIQITDTNDLRCPCCKIYMRLGARSGKFRRKKWENVTRY